LKRKEKTNATARGREKETASWGEDVKDEREGETEEIVMFNCERRDGLTGVGPGKRAGKSYSLLHE